MHCVNAMQAISKMLQRIVMERSKSNHRPHQVALSYAQAFAKLIGKKWTINILENLLNGLGQKYFTELKTGLHGISSKMLSARLKELQQWGIVIRILHQETMPIGVSYCLTKKGWGLAPIIEGLEQWQLHFKNDELNWNSRYP